MSIRRLLASLCALVGIFVLSCTAAQAADTHDYLFEFNEVPANSGAPLPGPVTSVNAMTVDSGHVWIAEGVSGSNGLFRVDEFNAATGSFVSPTRARYPSCSRASSTSV